VVESHTVSACSGNIFSFQENSPFQLWAIAVSYSLTIKNIIV